MAISLLWVASLFTLPSLFTMGAEYDTGVALLSTMGAMLLGWLSLSTMGGFLLTLPSRSVCVYQINNGKKQKKKPTVLKGYAAWTNWRQIRDDQIKIALIKKLMGGSIHTKRFSEHCKAEYEKWLCREEVRRHVGMDGSSWEDVCQAYPTLTTPDMMAK
ncbi:MAG TPA: hypothetical protein V6C97_16110 [Oculatellaceae cyanobacterium]